MNPNKPSPPPDDFESKITALLLGELAPADARAVERSIAADPALAALRDRLQNTMSFVRDAVTQPVGSAAAGAVQPRLSDKRREDLTRQFKLVARPERSAWERRWLAWLVPMTAAAALVVIAALFLPAFGKAKSKSQSVAYRRPGTPAPRLITRLGVEVPSPAPNAESLERIKTLPALQTRLARGHAVRPADEPDRGATEAKVRELYDQTDGDATAAPIDPTTGLPVVAESAVAPEAEWVRMETAQPAPTSSREGVETAAKAGSGEVESARPMTDIRMLMRYGLLPKGLKLVEEAGESAGATIAAKFAEGPQADASSLAENAPAQRQPLAKAATPPAPAQSELAPLPLELPLPAFMGTPTDLAFADGAPKDKAKAPESAGVGELAQATSWGETAPGFPGVREDYWFFDAEAAGGVQVHRTDSSGMGGMGGMGGGGMMGGMAGAGGGGGLGGFGGMQAAGDRSAGDFDLGQQVKTDQRADPAKDLFSTIRAKTGDSDSAGRPARRAAAPVSAPATPVPTTPVPPPSNAPPPPSSDTRASTERSAAGYYAYGLSAQKGVTELAKVPVLGDVPLIGAEFRSSTVEPESLGRPTRALANEPEAVGALAPSAGKPTDSSVRRLTVARGEQRGRARGLEPQPSATERQMADEDGALDRLGESEGTLRDGRLDVLAVNGVQEGAAVDAQAVTTFDATAAASGLITNAMGSFGAVTFAAQEEVTNRKEKVASRPAAPPPEPQPEVATASNPFSTFSLNVTDVSFKLAGASLEQGALPDASRIRSEEFLNAFDYRDPEPVRGAPVAFAWERARYPFAHNREAIRFSVQTAARGRSALRPLNLVLLLDSSGSMERADRVGIVREALTVLAAQLKPQDRISVVAFARTARLWVDGVPGNQANEVLERISQLTPEGGTNLEDALKVAYETAARHFVSHGVNRVVLLTDGAANLGDVDPESLQRKVESSRKQGIALDCFGIGWEGYNDDLLEVLSSHGDGRYGFVNSPEEAATELAGQLAGALQVAAADVKVQVEFNPHRATAWRQIGYAKHQLTKEQFRDNTVDAAELGAAESGNAVYILEVNPRGQGDIGTVRVRYREASSGLYREHAWRVPYTGPAPLLEQSSPAMRLAVSAVAFAEWLASSPFAGEVTPDKLLGTMSGVTDAFGPDARPRQLEAMIRAANSISGQ